MNNGDIALVIKDRRHLYKELSGLAKEKERTFEGVRDSVFTVKKSVPKGEDFMLEGSSGYSKALKKAGTMLILSSPVPFVSDILGVGFLATGVISEYKRRKRLQRVIEDYVYLINNESVF